MSTAPSRRGPWPVDDVEVARLRVAERAGMPLLILRQGDGRQHLVPLRAEPARLIVGRLDRSDVQVGWDDQVSRSHAVLERVGGMWSVLDAGLSRNGTYVNGERVRGHQRLVHGDVVRVGRTPIVFWFPGGDGEETVEDPGTPAAPDLSPAQRRVLVALCAPCLGPEIAPPASNEEIAHQLSLTVDAVKAHLRVLYRKFGVAGLPQTRKRLRLVALALESGAAGRPDV